MCSSKIAPQPVSHHQQLLRFPFFFTEPGRGGTVCEPFWSIAARLTMPSGTAHKQVLHMHYPAYTLEYHTTLHKHHSQVYRKLMTGSEIKSQFLCQDGGRAATRSFGGCGLTPNLPVHQQINLSSSNTSAHQSIARSSSTSPTSAQRVIQFHQDISSALYRSTVCVVFLMVV